MLLPLPTPTPAPKPVFSLGLDGAMRLRGGGLAPVFRMGTGATSADGYTGFSFDGRTSGIGLGDPPALRLSRSLSIACWVRLESYAQGAESQIAFRGDDRGGLDPYSLRVLADGRVAFTVENQKAQADHVAAPISLHRWTHVLGSLDDRTGQMALWIDGVKAAAHPTAVRPFARLDPKASPGVSIGNVQVGSGVYNQPLEGQIAALGIYDRAVTPTEIRYSSIALGSPTKGMEAGKG